MADKIKVGIVGSQFIAGIHAESFARVPNCEVAAVASPNNAAEFAERHGIPRALSDYRDLLNIEEIDVISLALPNDLHKQVTVDAAKAGKHVVCEKPLCLTLTEADEMIAACRDAGVQLFYAEELCFAPKYVRAKQLVDDGALGEVFLVKQAEEHSGPHAPWFWDVRRSGGGAVMDMGCHGIAFARWIMGNQPITQVSATMGTFVHGDKTAGEDHSLIVLTFASGAIALIEDSWAKLGGMDDRAEIYGSKGHTRADLIRGSSLLTYSEAGYGYAVEKAGVTHGWTFTIYEEAWNYGFPQEMQYFVDCIQRDEPSFITGEDGRAVLEAIYAAYHSAGTGQTVGLPFVPPPGVNAPIELWVKGSLSYHIGVDLGGTNIKFALLDGSLTVVERHTVSTEGHEGHDAVIERMIAGAFKLEGVAGGSGRVASVGVAVPGVLDMMEGETVFLPNLPGTWPRVPVGRKMREATGLSTYLINDVRAFTVAELELGSAKGAETAICYAVGTGIGGGIVAHGKVNFGVGGAGGELGHMVVDAHGPRCGCGNRGCAEAFATGPAIVGEANRRIVQGATTILHDLIDNDLNKMTARIIEDAAAKGDAVAIEVLENAGYYLGLAVANAIAALAPEVVVLGGGNCKPGGVFWKAIESTARAHSHVTNIDRIAFKPAALGYEAGVIGAAIWGKKVAAGEARPAT